MSDRKLVQSVKNLQLALARLEEALAEDLSNSLLVDGTIQRFEFAIELYWKTLNRLLESEGIETKTPKEALKEAYQVGWLRNEKDWLQMLKDRNETHTYDEQAAIRILRNIQGYFPEMKATMKLLQNKVGE